MNRVEQRIQYELDGFTTYNKSGYMPSEINENDLLEVIIKDNKKEIRKTAWAFDVNWACPDLDSGIHWYRVVKESAPVNPDFHGIFEALTEEQKDKIINPKHYEIIPPSAYKDHPDGLEYMDIMRHSLAHLTGVEAHVVGQIFKYLFRLGKKDSKLQDANKIAWYSARLVEEIEWQNNLHK